MTQSDSTDPRRWIVVASLLLLAAGLLFGTDLLGPAADHSSTDPEARIENADMLRAPGADAPTSPGELVGDADAAARRAARGRGPLTVTVLGPNDVPLSKVFVVLGGIKVEGRPLEVPLREQLTDAMGRARFADVPYDGTAHVGLRVQQIPPENASFLSIESSDVNIFRVLADTPGMRLQAIKGPSATVRTRVGLPFDLRFVDAVTGRPVRGATGSVWPGFQGAWGKAAPPGGAAAIGRGMQCHYRIAVDVPLGYVPFQGRLRVSRPIHPDVTRATHVVALHREAEILLVANRGTSLPALEDSLLYIGTGHQYREAKFNAPDGFGRVRVKESRFVPYVPVSVYWTFASGAVARGQGRFGAVHTEGLVIELDITPASDMDEVEEEIEESIETDNDLEDEEIVGENESAPALARVVLHVTRPDGTPATFAVAQVGTLKSGFLPEHKGSLDWPVLPGTHDVFVWGAGADLRRTLQVGPGPSQDVRLHGTEGGRLHVSIRDTEKRALPHALVSIVGPTHWAQSDVKDGHQRLDSLTNAEGERTFHRVAVGHCQAHIRYGGFQVTKSVEIHEGRTTKLDVEIDLSR